MSDTPETDAVWKGNDNVKQVMTSRRLERERDEAREAWYQMQSSFERSRDEVERVIRERDEARAELDAYDLMENARRLIVKARTFESEL